MTRRAIPLAKTWSWLPARTCLVVFLRRKWRCPGFRNLTFPEPVILNLLAIPLCVFLILWKKKNNIFLCNFKQANTIKYHKLKDLDNFGRKTMLQK